MKNKKINLYREKGNSIMSEELRAYGTKNIADNISKYAIYKATEIATRNDTDKYKTSIQANKYSSISNTLICPTVK